MFDDRFPTSVRDRGGDLPPTGLPLYRGEEAVRAVRTTVLIGIAVRLFSIYACANQISVGYRVLGFTDPSGQLTASGQTAYDLAGAADDADGLARFAMWASVGAVVLFIIASVAVLRRKRLGEPVAVAFDKNRAVRLAGRLYGVVAVLAAPMRTAFTPDPNGTPGARVHTVIEGAEATIVVQILVIGLLTLIAMAASREL
ncbi:uncharacterized membrane protein YjfL (UPF0719 family) [Catenulispora sp. GP43]|uniref:hypothetical protein n=1 Tax=Catenulispora sp. GP43 TaxID=3156263 RepID=UPI0035161D61